MEDYSGSTTAGYGFPSPLPSFATRVISKQTIARSKPQLPDIMPTGEKVTIFVPPGKWCLVQVWASFGAGASNGQGFIAGIYKDGKYMGYALGAGNQTVTDNDRLFYTLGDATKYIHSAWAALDRGTTGGIHTYELYIRNLEVTGTLYLGSLSGTPTVIDSPTIISASIVEPNFTYHS